MFIKCQNGERSTITAPVAKEPKCRVTLFHMPDCVPISDLGIMDSNPTPPTCILASCLAGQRFAQLTVGWGLSLGLACTDGKQCYCVCYMLYVMLYGYFYSASRRRLFRGALNVTGRWKEYSSNYVGTQMIFPVASHSGVQQEYHSKVLDTMGANPGGLPGL